MSFGTSRPATPDVRAGVWWWAGVLLVALIHSSAAGQTPWTRVLERDGVVVDERPASDANPLETRATTHIDSTVLEILAFLLDDAKRTEWMARCIEARSLEVRSRWNRLSYDRFTVWPLSDRDVVVETLITLDRAATSADIQMRNTDSKLQPHVAGAVRMPSMLGDLRLDRVDGGTQVAFTLSMELGGRAPTSISNHARRLIPRESLANLREMVPASRDRYAELIRSWQSELRP